ncbi:PIF-1 [Betabaculovirus altermyunipunctae]|uniref:PIF-1 n=1 Tax=Betabaculovirus altermyunipunctae TaxID=3051996 RepID=A0A1S5YDZ1_9BBAC|nr:PIF-1 [Betabaculovirus altermyunipunctae]AQQ80343.1 PIF-1 [Betabaculovirus altermyunipunctae]
MNYPLYAVLVVVMVVMVVLHSVNLYNNIEPVAPIIDIPVHDNSHVPEIRPPEVIVIEENELKCHENLTRCDTNTECQLCHEALATCYTFQEDVVLELPDGESQLIRPGESYCLALDNKHARSCNPHTGTWVMRQVDSINYAIICHCDFPGLVVQATIYDDCDIDVGCRPNGRIASLYETPLRCECNAGYYPDINEHGPFCRPTVVRDVMSNPAYFHRPPCRQGYIENTHPGLQSFFHRLFQFTVCIPDPCSIDPVTGLKHSGRLEYFPTDGPNNTPISMCICDVLDDLYPVYSPHSIVDQRYGDRTNVMANACLKPLTVSRQNVRSDLKVFWGNGNVLANADMVFQVEPHMVHSRYRKVLLLRFADHPRENLDTDYLLKFQISSCYFRTVMQRTTGKDIYHYWWDYNFLRRHNNNDCPLPGIGQCHRTCSTGNVSTTCNPCIGSNVASSFRNQCYFVRQTRTVDNLGEIGQLCMGNTATFYDSRNVPVTYYLSGRFVNEFGYGRPKENQTIYFVSTGDTILDASQHNNAAIIMDTYPWYSNN